MKKMILVLVFVIFAVFVLSGCQPKEEPYGRILCYGERVIELPPFPVTWIPVVSGSLDDFVEGRCIAETNVSIFIETLRFGQDDTWEFEGRCYKDGETIKMEKDINSFEVKIGCD